MSASILVLDRVTKRFGDFTAVDGLSFDVPEGGVFGFLGGNGAGKTTSLRMTLDIIRPTSGRIEVMGGPPARDNAAEIGFLPEERGLYRLMTVFDTIVYFGGLKRMNRAAAREAAGELIERLGLADRARTPVGKLSKGLAQKVQLATALVNSPRLILLDEPFSGLDPVNQGVLEDVIRELAGRGFDGGLLHPCDAARQAIVRSASPAGARTQGVRGTQEEARASLPARLILVGHAGAPSGLPGVASASALGPAEDKHGPSSTSRFSPPRTQAICSRPARPGASRFAASTSIAFRPARGVHPSCRRRSGDRRMRAILLVAARDFRQIVATRGFMVTVLIVPFAVAVSIFGSIMFAPKNTSAFSLVDASGRYGAQVERRLELDYQREVLRSLSAYVDRWQPASIDPAAA